MCGVEAAGKVAKRYGAWAKVLTNYPEVWSKAYESLKADAPVYFEPLNVQFQLADTPLQGWLGDGSWLQRHPDPYRDLSHVLRAVLLYKWGGMFVDFDTLLVNDALMESDAFVALQDESFINNHIVRFPKSHPLAREWLEALAKTCKLNSGIPTPVDQPSGCDREVLHSLYRERCAVHSSSVCVGIELLRPAVATPLGWEQVAAGFKAQAPGAEDQFGDALAAGMQAVHWYYKAALGAEWAARPVCVERGSFMEEAMRLSCRKTMRVLESVLICGQGGGGGGAAAAAAQGGRQKQQPAGGGFLSAAVQGGAADGGTPQRSLTRRRRRKVRVA